MYIVNSICSLNYKYERVNFCRICLLSFVGGVANKENEFSGSLKALGILIDLSEVKLLKVRFSNTDERRFEVTHDIKAILKTGRLGRSEGQRNRGRLLFAESQIHGRRSIRQMQVLSKHIHTCASMVLDT